MKVCKFGGSSLANAEQFKKVKDIIFSDVERKIVVVSAIGKESKDDYKVTDLLYLTFSHIKYKFDYHPVFETIKKKYYDIEKNLGIKPFLKEEFDLIERKILEGIDESELVSRGEYLNALLMAKYLGYDFVDSTNFIKFSYDGKIDEKRSLQAMNDYSFKNKGIVVPGFYGVYPNGKICLFSRGGSDITGSYLAVGFKCDLYENFTDVNGILMSDPKIISSPRKIKTLTYKELRELSYSGATVLHEDAILPLEEHLLPLKILNTNEPKDDGTLIENNADDKTYLITGITGKKDFIAFTFIKSRQCEKLDALLSVLEALKKHNITIEHIPSSIDAFSIVIERKKILERYYDVIADLKKLDTIESFKEDNDLALIAVVGRNMISKAGTSGRIMSVFGKEKINIKILDQSRDEINIIIGISNSDFEKTIKVLYDAFANERV